jgi:hypothetical protein
MTMGVKAAMCGRLTNTQRKSDDLLNKLTDRLGLQAPDSDRGFERFNYSADLAGACRTS